MKWWRDFVGGFRGWRDAARMGGRFGRIFRLRDRGRLEEALQAALALGADVKVSEGMFHDSNSVLAAAVIDEIAQRLDRHEVAYDALVYAIAVIETEKARSIPKLPPNDEVCAQQDERDGGELLGAFPELLADTAAHSHAEVACRDRNNCYRDDDWRHSAGRPGRG